MSDPEYGEYDERPGRDLLEYFEIPFRYRRQMWIPFALILAFFVLLAFTVPRKYRSGTLILVESKNLPEYFVTPVTADGMAQRLNTIRQVVMSRTRLERVIKKLDPYPEMAGQPSHVVVETMRRAIDIKVQGADSFAIEYVNTDPTKAMMVTSLLSSQFIEDAASLRETLTQKAFDFIETNLNEAKRAIEDREEALRRHKLKYWGSLPEQLETNLRVLGQLQFEQQTLGESLRTLEDRRALLERNLLEGRRFSAASAPSGAAGELAKLRTSYDTLRDRYTQDHPDMRALRTRIERLEQQARAEPSAVPGAGDASESASLAQSLQLVESEIESMKTRRDKLDEKIVTYQSRVEETPRAEQELAGLSRDYQQLKDNYNVALKKEMDAEMARRLEEYWKGGYFRVLDPAYLPRRPIRPYGSLMVMAGLFFGLAGGLLCAFVADLLDRSVKSERQLAELMAAPLLVSIPHVSSQRAKATA